MSEEPTRLDRRQRKSRAALQAALISLVAQKPYPAITVDDIAEAADVARATLYAHYRDKDSLLAATIGDLVDELGREVAQVAWTGPAGVDGRGAVVVLNHARGHADLYRLVISGAGGAEPRRQLIGTMTTAVTDVLTGGGTESRTTRVPMDMIAHSFVGALLALVEVWLDRDDADTETFAALFIQQQFRGLEWALGFAPGEMRVSGPS